MLYSYKRGFSRSSWMIRISAMNKKHKKLVLSDLNYFRPECCSKKVHNSGSQTIDFKQITTVISKKFRLLGFNARNSGCY